MSNSSKIFYAVQELYESGYSIDAIIEDIVTSYNISSEYVLTIIETISKENPR